MKKTIFYLVAAMAVLACSKTEEKEVVVEPQKPVYTLYGTIAQETGTKVYINDDGLDDDNKHWFSHHWEEGDDISVFDSNNMTDGGLVFTVPHKEGSYTNVGEFTGEVGVEDAFYAIYPHNSSNAVEVNEEVPTFTVTYPAAQTLTEGSYDPAANVYVATGEDINLTFYNTTAYLRLALYSSTSATVSKIELTALSNTSTAVAIAGTGTVTLVTENEITSVDAVSVSGSNTITLTSENADGESISNDSDSPTYFYVAVPAVDYATNFAGYQVRIYSGSDNNETYQFRNFSTPLTANKVRLLPALEYNPVSSGSTATLITGQDLNKALKSLAAGSSVTDHTAEDNSIIKIIIETNKNMTGYTGTVEKQTIVSETGSELIVASYKDGTIRIQTAASKILTQSCASMFRSFTALTDITGFEGFIIGQSKSMAYMFMNSNNLKSVDLTNMGFENNGYSLSCTQMFANCTALESVKFPNTTFYSSGLAGLFQNCSNLSSLTNLNKIRSASSGTGLTNVSKMFYGCANLTEVSFHNSFTCSKVTDMSEMFSGCTSLKGTGTGPLLLSNFDTKKVTTAHRMFYNCSSLTGITFGTNSTFEECTNMSYMFYTCEKIKDLDLSMFNNSVVTTMAYMFQYCRALETLDISGISTENLSPGTATTGTTGGFTRFLNVCNNVKLVKFGQNFTLNGVKNYTNGLQGTANLLSTPDAPMVFWCSATLAQNFIQNLVSVRTWLNNEDGPIILFKTTDGTKDLVLSDSPGSVTEDTTVSEP